VSDYDPQNIFGKILRGEIPSTKVYENDHLLVIMDAFPQSKGHTLVLPKAGSRNILDADPAVVAKVAADLPRLARAVKTAMHADGLRVMQFNEAPAGQTVFHLHFHLIPIYEGIEMGRHGQGQANALELTDQAKAIKALL
jgi:histidine triad (HIT) family protein